jgi:hypothetical protein
MSQQDSTSTWEMVFVVVIVCFLAIGFFTTFIVPNMVRGGTSNANICINNLRQIDAAKEEWALENRITNGDVVPTENDITPYIQLNSSGKIPPCPSGGIYTIGKLSVLPKCSIGTNDRQPHVLILEPERSH